MNFAPSVTASFSAAPRSLIRSLFASTRMMLQFGQMAEIASRLSEVSGDHADTSVG